MSHDLIERVARAIYPYDAHVEGECDVCDAEMRAARATARRALAAMREPTEAMVAAGKAIMWRDDMAADVWRGMVDVALADTEADPTMTAGALE